MPKAGKMPAGKAPSKGAVEKKKRRSTRHESFNTYIYKILRQVHQDFSISKRGMAVMDSLAYDIVNRISFEAASVAKLNKKSTVGSREVQTAVRLVFPGELAKHGVSEGLKAMQKYTSSKGSA